MRAIVTGGTGFIGSWLIEELLMNNYIVYLLVRNKRRLLSNIYMNDKCRVIEKHIEDVSENDFPQNEKYDCFFHLAWEGVSPEKKNDEATQLKNISMSLRMLELCNKLNCKLFIGSGTVAEYFFSENVLDINAKQTPNDLYGAAKVSTHYFIEVKARQLKQPFVWAVIPSTYGERRNDNNIITYTIKTLLKNEKPKYGDLKQMWDFLYVGEVVRALRLISENGKTNKVYGIGSGEYFPLYTYMEKIRDVINPKLELGIGELPNKSDSVFSSCVNIKELVDETGFCPQVKFEDGIQRTINWFESQLYKMD